MECNSNPALKVAIIGAGPSGFYAAEALSDLCPTCEIDLIDRLPTPYGLIRSGVAPDHQTTKAIQATFESVAGRNNIRFVGHVHVGRDLSLEELRELYDAVILATGTPYDVPLGLPGEDIPGVYGAARFVGWYNGHPDESELRPDLSGTAAVVIGNGNVAIDVARILSKSRSELSKTDIAAHALEAIAASSINAVHIVGRRGPVEAKFTNAELVELGELPGVAVVTNPGEIPDAILGQMSPKDRRSKSKNLECFHRFADRDDAERRKIHFHFHARPMAIVGDRHVQAVRFERTITHEGAVAGTGEWFDIPCGLVVYAIGYRPDPEMKISAGFEANRIRNENGRVADGIYAVGWLKRGPSGKIGTNRLDSEEVARRLVGEVEAAGKPGYEGLCARLDAAQIRWTSFEYWKALDALEVAAGQNSAPRKKFVRISDMFEALR
jgi:NADPH-dependent glutamate synthase beta subunit-like oxidoreductase